MGKTVTETKITKTEDEKIQEKLRDPHTPCTVFTMRIIMERKGEPIKESTDIDEPTIFSDWVGEVSWVSNHTHPVRRYEAAETARAAVAFLQKQLLAYDALLHSDPNHAYESIFGALESKH